MTERSGLLSALSLWVWEEDTLLMQAHALLCQ